VILTGVLVQCHIVSPFQLFYSFKAVFHRSQVSHGRTECVLNTYTDPTSQYWRLLTTFIYFGPLSFNLLFHIFFMQRYARMLEEAAASPANFSWMMAYATTTLLCLAPFFHQAFLGTTLSSTLVYIWSRRNPDTVLSFLGLITFRAPWLPFFMIGLSIVFHGHWPKDELFGIAVGHVWYFFNDIYPSTHNGRQPMAPPRWWVRMFERGDPAVTPTELQAAPLHGELAAPPAPEIQ